MKRFPFPLQYSIPTILFLLSGISGFYAFQREISTADRRVEEQTIQRAKFKGSKTSALLEFIFRTEEDYGADLEGANLIVSQLGGDPNLRLAILLDESNQVALATHYNWRNQPVEKTPLGEITVSTDMLDQARQTLAGQVNVMPDRQSVLAFYPVRLQPKLGELRSSQLGVLVLEYDMFAQKQQTRQDVLQLWLQTNGVLVLLYVVIWFFFERTVTRRAAHLVGVSNSLAEGNLGKRAQLRGSDELAQIAVAFNRMAGQLQLETEELRQAKHEREHAEEALRQIIEGTAAFTGQDFFPELVSHIAEALAVRCVSIAQATSQGFQMLAFYADGALQSPMQFLDYSTVPCCMDSGQTRQCCLPEVLRSLDPENACLGNLKVESCLGVGLQTTDGKTIGSLCILHDRPLPDLEWAKTLLHIFAARAGAELERYQTSLELELLNNQLEQRVQERTEQLRARELQLEDLFDNANDLIQSVRLSDGQFEYVNRAWLETLGYTSGEVDDLNIFDILHPSHHEHYKSFMARVVESETCSLDRIEQTFLTKDQQEILVEGSLNCRFVNNLPVATRAIFRDITERKQAEIRLKESELRYASLASIAPVGIFRTNAQGDCLYVNRQWCEFAGMTPAEAMGQGWIRALYPEDQAAVYAEWYAAAEENRNFSLEYRFQATSGKITWLYGQSGAERDAEGNITGYIGTVTDITDRTQAEQQLRDSELRYASLAAIAPVGIFRSDIQGNCLYVNEQWCQFAGLSPEKALGMGWLQAIHPDDRQQVESTWYKATQENCSFKMEYRLQRPDGRVTWLYVQAGVERDAKNLVTGYVSTLTNITELKATELQLHATNEELLRATRLKDEFLATMSHELRTPLNAILGMTEGLQEQVFGTITKKQDKALQTIAHSGSHLLELINDILDLAKIESGQIELDLKLKAIPPLCQSSLVFIKQQAYKKQIHVLSQLPDNLPHLIIDERRIRQVLINLLNNAVKFTPKGGQVTLKIEYFSQPIDIYTKPSDVQINPAQLPSGDLSSHGRVRFLVQDTGIGIAPEHIDKIFKPFIQIDSALNRHYSGTGLGLALVKNIVELHGGTVGLTSEVGVGSCFTFDLPCEKVSTRTTIPVMQKERAGEDGEPSSVQQYRAPLILLAEDYEANIITMSSYLTAKGYKICLAQNGREALEKVQTERPDLILMDIQMPEMDGLEAIQKIRQIPEVAFIPIIALTALTMEGDKEKCLQAGANQYLSKPVRLKPLVAMIQQLLPS